MWLSVLLSNLQRVLISSSSHDTRILKKVFLIILHDLASSYGFKLGISYFTRDKQSWLNSVHCHRVRRFRSTQGFSKYCRCIMKILALGTLIIHQKLASWRDILRLRKCFAAISVSGNHGSFFSSCFGIGFEEASDNLWLMGELSKKNIQLGGKVI